MPSQPRVTVCIPTIPGREDLFSRAVESTGDLPLSVSHGTGQIEDAYANWWRAIDGARTEWVILLFDDDWLEPGFYDRIAPILLEEPSVVIVNAWLELGSDQRQAHFGDAALPERVQSQEAINWILHQLPLTITPSTVVMRRDTARRWLWPGGLPCGLTPVPNAGCDAIMVLGGLLDAPTAAWVPDKLVHLDAGPQSTTIRELAEDKGRRLMQSYEMAKSLWKKLCAST